MQLSVFPTAVTIQGSTPPQEEAQKRKSEDISTEINSIPVDTTVRALVADAETAKKLANCIGTKAFNAFILESLSQSCGLFKTPKSCCLPYGALGHILKAKNPGEEESSNSISAIFTQLGNAEDGATVEKFHALLHERLTIKFAQENCRKIVEEYAAQIKAQLFPKHKLVAIRSSSNVEDLKKLSGAGLFDSILNVQSSDESVIAEALKEVWRSLYSRRAMQSRLKYKINEEKASMAILIQEMISADASFIIHTTNPVPLQK